MALENSLNTAVGIGRQLRQIQTGRLEKKPATIKAYSDSTSLIESINSTKPVDEGSMRASVHRIKDYLDHQDITAITWVPTHEMLADSLTKKKANTTSLTQMMKTGGWKRVETERRGESE